MVVIISFAGRLSDHVTDFDHNRTGTKHAHAKCASTEELMLLFMRVWACVSNLVPIFMGLDSRSQHNKFMIYMLYRRMQGN